MKKLLYFTLLIGGLIISKTSEAQINVNINIGSQPLWGPVGYDYVRYYYIPAIDVYYNVDSRRYTYYHGNRWVTKSSLPTRYRNFDLYRTHKVVINDRNPWKNHRHHRNEYSHNHASYNHSVLRDVRHSSHRSVTHRKSTSRDAKFYKKMEKEHNKHRSHKHDKRR